MAKVMQLLFSSIPGMVFSDPKGDPEGVPKKEAASKGGSLFECIFKDSAFTERSVS
jgi:hypothetical protein